MAPITSKQRKGLPKADFALPSKRSASGGSGGYPIDTPNRARNALSRISQFGNSSQKAAVRSKVKKKFSGKSK